jgi:hypothetical protein
VCERAFARTGPSREFQRHNTGANSQVEHAAVGSTSYTDGGNRPNDASRMAAYEGIAVLGAEAPSAGELGNGAVHPYDVRRRTINSGAY